jgi:hypothetical protein
MAGPRDAARTSLRERRRQRDIVRNGGGTSRTIEATLG